MVKQSGAVRPRLPLTVGQNRGSVSTSQVCDAFTQHPRRETVASGDKSVLPRPGDGGEEVGYNWKGAARGTSLWWWDSSGIDYGSVWVTNRHGIVYKDTGRERLQELVRPRGSFIVL